MMLVAAAREGRFRPVAVDGMDDFNARKRSLPFDNGDPIRNPCRSLLQDRACA